MDDLCPCGTPADFEREAHRYATHHDCAHHNTAQCRVCFTIRQVEYYLAGFPARKTGEAA